VTFWQSLPYYNLSDKTLDIHLEKEIDAPAEEVWAVLAHEFAEIDKWSSTVNVSRTLEDREVPPGFAVAAEAPIPGRSTTSPVGEIHEIFTMYCEENMEYTFRAAELPFLLAYAHNTHRVVSIGDDRSLLTFDLRMELSGIFKAFGSILRGRFESTFGLVQ
ncbi:SRPBCC family protein, partial [Chloroflexi bacterium TSY]|nr:SRPBCC family protein [Chloroflexi bacterium TSY]